MLKDTYIRMRLTAEEKQEIREAAECDRTNMTDYILSLVHKEKTRMESKECMGCKQNAVDKYKRMTQADRIRSFSDEELADFLADSEIFSPCKNCDFHFVDAMNDDCKAPDGWICTKGYAAALIQKWLQSEVEA